MPYKDPKKQKEAQNEWYRNNKLVENLKRSMRKKTLRTWYQEEVKTRFQCARCGENHIACIDFHHPTKDKDSVWVSRMPKSGFSRERILQELQKCIPLCANCHRKLHYREKMRQGGFEPPFHTPEA